ncbi:preprotein translocase subunit SecA [Xenorhabdus stockiae]|uniref:Preprotein translocase subunit SecA n=1 Tax=Xenorhabdus stockiae TaxID=351614 RepID=A0A2D0KRS8_9GAMM|nr:SEC-C metal-binding domain-containing protein [Xenorhabdus stockiae]PHM66122.1 preprotein translocase subunit SecA [Xenorhabdus stockiae]
MKFGRNDPCPCGSGKKYKRCCMDSVSKQQAKLLDDISQFAAMNPNLTLDELNAVTQHRVNEHNNRPNTEFCGLSPTQMNNWMYAPFDQLSCVTINTPDDLSSSPVMRYLGLILDEAMQNEGSFKATTKGNLPTKLVKQACDLLPEFPVAKFIRINEFSGSNEDKFNALHYTRILAEIAGIIYRRSGRYYVKKDVQKQYQTHGINAFFLPMLEAATTQYNWGYLDNWEDIDIRTFWLFMVWRLQCHGSVDQLSEEVTTAFPALLHQFIPDEYFSPTESLKMVIESRFIARFLQFWGFVTIEYKWGPIENALPRKADILPLLTQTFRFAV